MDITDIYNLLFRSRYKVEDVFTEGDPELKREFTDFVYNEICIALEEVEQKTGVEIVPFVNIDKIVKEHLKNFSFQDMLEKLYPIYEEVTLNQFKEEIAEMYNPEMDVEEAFEKALVEMGVDKDTIFYIV